MSPSCFITTRVVKSGKRYVVRYRLGGRYTALTHAGSFKTMKDARARRDFVSGEIAAGRDPRASLHALTSPPARRTLTEWAEAFAASRVDVGESAKSHYGVVTRKLGTLADLEPAEITPAHIQEWVAANSKLAPKTIRIYLSIIRLFLDYANVEPNPARSRRVRLPAETREEPTPPTRQEWDLIKGRIPVKHLLVLRLIEATGLRVGEATSFTWGDIDFASGQLRVSAARSKGGTAGRRWLPVPPELLDRIGDLMPFEDRQRDRAVFPVVRTTVRTALATACQLAGTAHYHPHELRHRRVSLWFALGFDAIMIRTWSGHSRASMSSDTYGHVVVGGDEWADFWKTAYVSARLPRGAESSAREAPVRSEDDQ